MVDFLISDVDFTPSAVNKKHTYDEARTMYPYEWTSLSKS